MEEKKVREAIEIINNFTVWNIDELWLDCEDMEELVNTLTIALEKQLPKKVEIMDYVLGDINFKCTICKNEYVCEKEREHFYCPNCGQKLDWSEEEELNIYG